MIKNLIPTLAVLSLGFSAFAGDWTNWRGPNYNGATTATGLPTKFSKTEKGRFLCRSFFLEFFFYLLDTNKYFIHFGVLSLSEQ